MLDVLTVGSATRDVFARTSAITSRRSASSPSGKEACFPLGSKLDLDGLSFQLGGGAVNTAFTFANLGFKAGVVAAAGNDRGGEDTARELRRRGIDTSRLHRVRGAITSHSLILSLPDGSRTIFQEAGAVWRFPKSAARDVKGAAWLYLNHLGGEADALVADILKKAKKEGMKVAWNPGRTQIARPARLKSLLGFADCFLVNQEEASRITGVRHGDTGGIFKALDRLVGGLVVMTKGPKGVEVSDGTSVCAAGILPMNDVVDRTGAGDAFGSGFVASLLENPDDVAGAIRLGSANATGVLREWGATNGLLKNKKEAGTWGQLKVTVKKL